MFEQILPDLFRIEVPLPQSPLKYLNSYLIKDKDRSLIIDTGMNRPECLGPLLSSLKELEVDLNRTDFFITHVHADHIGLLGELATKTSRLYFNHVEPVIVNADRDKIEERFQKLFDFYVDNGFPEEELRKAFANHPGARYSPKRKFDFTILKDGDVLNIGGYSFKIIETPGHSPGHMCLYEPDKKILFSGDHILFDITPNITTWPELSNSLQAYLESLEKVKNYEVNLVLPGHRNTWTSHQNRIAELQEHHRNRLDEVISALEGGDKTAWEIAPFIRWDINISSWDLFPGVQKWFALGETIAHINYLIGKGSVVIKENKKTLYSLA